MGFRAAPRRLCAPGVIGVTLSVCSGERHKPACRGGRTGGGRTVEMCYLSLLTSKTVGLVTVGGGGGTRRGARWYPGSGDRANVRAASSGRLSLVGCDYGDLKTHKWECRTLPGGYLDKTWKRGGWSPGAELTRWDGGESSWVGSGRPRDRELRLEDPVGCLLVGLGPRTAWVGEGGRGVPGGPGREDEHDKLKPRPMVAAVQSGVPGSCLLLPPHRRPF